MRQYEREKEEETELGKGKQRENRAWGYCLQCWPTTTTEASLADHTEPTAASYCSAEREQPKLRDRKRTSERAQIRQKWTWIKGGTQQMYKKKNGQKLSKGNYKQDHNEVLNTSVLF